MQAEWSVNKAPVLTEHGRTQNLQEQAFNREKRGRSIVAMLPPTHRKLFVCFISDSVLFTVGSLRQLVGIVH